MTHLTEIKTGSALVIDVRDGGAASVTTYQGKCTCGWTGPRRTAAWEAIDDNKRHQKHPMED